MNLTQPHINLKGFIVVIGVTDYKTDPYVTTWETANDFNIISNEFFERYEEAGCKMSI